MSAPVRGLMVAAPQSGSGKTVVTLALARALARRGLDIRAAKAGPDFIDPGFHALACGHPCVNLDPWAMAPARLRALAGGQGGSHLMVEAMMGLFDGAADGSGSAADLAVILDIPAVLVVDVARQGQSVAALVRGFRDHRPELVMAGVILNRVGSDRHAAMLRRALAGIGVAVLGVIGRDDGLALPQRHLGLVQAEELPELEAFIATAAEGVAAAIDLDRLCALFAPMRTADPAPRMLPPGQRIAIASDAAFSFLYPHLVADWRVAGAEIALFSPLADEGPSPQADAVLLPGGYPELHGGRLAAAAGFHDRLRRAAASGALVYGECGGFMVLGEGIEDADGRRHAMAGLLKLETSFARRHLHLGYRRLEAGQGFAFGRCLTAHEFHYSTALREEGETLFAVRDALGADLGRTGLRRGNVMGSYMHVIDAAP